MFAWLRSWFRPSAPEVAALRVELQQVRQELTESRATDRRVVDLLLSRLDALKHSPGPQGSSAPDSTIARSLADFHKLERQIEIDRCFASQPVKPHCHEWSNGNDCTLGLRDSLLAISRSIIRMGNQS